MDKELAARLAKALAVTCVRNTSLADLRAGISPSSRAGDHSEVMVVTRSASGVHVRSGRNVPSKASHL